MALKRKYNAYARFKPYAQAARSAYDVYRYVSTRMGKRRRTSRTGAKRGYRLQRNPRGGAGLGGFISNRRYGRYRRSGAKYRRYGERLELNTVGSSSTSSAVGKQACDLVFSAGTDADMEKMMTMSSKNNQDVKSIYIDNITVSNTYSNGSAGNVTMWVYDCVAKRDVYTGDATHDFYNPVAAWQFGADDMSGLTNGHQVPFATPHAVPHFNTFWKIKGVRKRILAAGESWECVNNYKLGVSIPDALLRHSGASMFKGVSFTRFCVILGQVAVDSTGGNVSYAVAKINYCGSTKLRGWSIPYREPKLDYDNNLPTTVTGTHQVMDEQTYATKTVDATTDV